jgi:hypothetical protein
VQCFIRSSNSLKGGKAHFSMDDRRPVILLAFANDRGEGASARYLRNLPEEARRLRHALEGAERAGLCELVTRQNATAADVLDVFQDARYRDRVVVFHYGGHGDGYRLLMESAVGEPLAADAGGLAAFLGQQRGLSLVFLNACSTGAQVKGLLDMGVPVVVATADAIEDDAAVEFSDRFYTAIDSGATLRRAFAEASAAVAVAGGKATRDLTGTQPLQTDVLPWHLQFGEGAELAAEWSLPEAAGDPLYGLPTVTPRDLPENPYLEPLTWYSEIHAEVFFGRGYQVRELYERVTDSGRPPILLLYGRSGVGKSSILAAGLKPRLAVAGLAARYVRRDPQKGLLGSLRDALGGAENPSSVGDFWRATEKQIGQPMVVILDQVEEALGGSANVHSGEMSEFIIELTDAFLKPEKRPVGKLVLGFRMEWLAVIERRLAEALLPRAKMFLEPLDRRGIIEAIRGPGRLVSASGASVARPILSRRLVEHYDLEIEESLPEHIADDLLGDRDSLVAPTLQILLSTMWTTTRNTLPTPPRFDSNLYENLGRQGILLGDFLDRQLAALRSWRPESVDSGLVLDLLEYHTTPFGSAKVSSGQDLERAYAHTGPGLPELVQRAKDLYLLADAGSAGEHSQVVTRLAHDTLAPLVRERFDRSDRQAQRAWRILRNRLPEWGGGRVGSPLEGRDLQVVEHAERVSRAWSEDERRLVDASRKAEEQDARDRDRMHGESLLRGLGHGTGLIGPVELDALWDLATLPADAERVRIEILRLALEEEGSVEQLANRLDLVVHAAVGLVSTRRQAILGEIVLPGLRAASTNPRLAWTIARVGLAVRFEGDEFLDLASSALAACVEAEGAFNDAEWPILAARLTSPFADRIAAQLLTQHAIEIETVDLPLLTQWLASIGPHLSSAASERTGIQLLDLMRQTRQPEELATLTHALMWLNPGARLAEQAAGRLGDVFSNTDDLVELCLLEETRETVASRLGSSVVPRISAPPGAHSRFEVVQLARSLKQVGPRLTPAYADRACDRLLRVLSKLNAPTALETVSVAIESVAPRLTAQAAEQSADRILDDLAGMDTPVIMLGLCRAFRAIAPRLPSAQTASRAEMAFERVMEVFGGADCQEGLRDLAGALSRLAPLAPERNFGQDLSALGASRTPLDLLRLSHALAAFAPRLERAEVERAAELVAEEILTAIDESQTMTELQALAEACTVTMPLLESTATTKVRDRLVSTLCVVGDAPALKSLIDALLSIRHEIDAGFLLELLKYPLCVGGARASLLAALERRTSHSFGGDVWRLVEQAAALGFSDDVLSRPPTRTRAGG